MSAAIQENPERRLQAQHLMTELQEERHQVWALYCQINKRALDFLSSILFAQPTEAYRLMKHSMAVGVILLMGFGSDATAGPCSDGGYGTQLKATGGNSITDALSNKRIIATGGEEWKEDHCANGNLFKVGVSVDDPVDPRAYRGTWGVTGGGAGSQVTYSYTVGGTSNYAWKLWKNNDSGNLCWEDNSQIIATAPNPMALSGTCDNP